MFIFCAIMFIISPVYLIFYFFERDELNQMITGEYKYSKNIPPTPTS